MICVLNGAFMFFTDLIKDMGIDVEIDFIRAKSYNGRDNSSGVEVTKDIEIDLKGKRVYIVDDMIDTGATMLEILFRVENKTPADVSIVTLVDRQNRQSGRVDHTAFADMGSDFFVGYGFDDNGLKRNYRNIYSASVDDSE